MEYREFKSSAEENNRIISDIRNYVEQVENTLILRFYFGRILVRGFWWIN